MRPSLPPASVIPLLLLGLLHGTSDAQAESGPPLTSERQLTEARLPPTSSNRLSAAFDGANFLLVWSDVRGATPDIYGARISPAGELLAPGVFPISTAANEQQAPDVAFNGITFLVTWSDHRAGDAWSIYGARVTTTGTLLDANGLLLSLGLVGAEKYTPSVACTGTECLVTWSDRRTNSSWDILGVAVDANGVVTSAGDQVISGVNRGQFSPELVRVDTSYFAAWSDQRDFPDYGVYGTPINRSGQPTGSAGTGLGLKVSDASERPALVWDGANTWVAWTNTLASPSAPAIHLRSTQAAGGPVTMGEFTRRPALAFDGTSVWLAYESELPNLEHRVVARRFTRAGQAVDSAPFVLSGADPGASVPHLASDGQGHVLVAYASHEPGVPHEAVERLFYRVATALPAGAVCTGDAECASGTCASGRCCDRRCDQACETCLRAEGASADGVCGPAASRVCRAAASVCDVEERCTGRATTCPQDALARDDTACGEELVCRAGACQPTPPSFRGRLKARAVCGAAAEYHPNHSPDVLGAGPFTFSVDQGPEGLAVDPATGALQWIPDRSVQGSFTAQLHVTGPGGTAVEPMSIDVDCPGPIALDVACGCSGGGEGPWLWVLPGLLAWAWRRRVSPRCCAENRRSG